MKFRLATLGLILMLVAAFVAAPMRTQAAKPGGNPFKVNLTNAPLTHLVDGVVQTAGTFTGTVTVQRFVVQDGQLAAVVKVVGTIKNMAGEVIATVNQVLTVPLTTGQATCTILELHIGPIHLDLLGLVVDIAPIDIVITAQSGPGNLLGNLLCAIANALNQNNLNLVANLLNQLLSLFK